MEEFRHGASCWFSNSTLRIGVVEKGVCVHLYMYMCNDVVGSGHYQDMILDSIPSVINPLYYVLMTTEKAV